MGLSVVDHCALSPSPSASLSLPSSFRSPPSSLPPHSSQRSVPLHSHANTTMATTITATSHAQNAHVSSRKAVTRHRYINQRSPPSRAENTTLASYT